MKGMKMLLPKDPIASLQSELDTLTNRREGLRRGLETATQEAADANARRTALLIGSDGAIGSRELELADSECRMTADRNRALDEAFRAISEKIAETEHTLARNRAFAALEAERDAAEAEAQAVAKLLKTRYPALAKELVALLERLGAAEKAVAAVNEKLVEAGRVDELLAEVEWRSMPRHLGELEELYSIRRRTTLLELSEFSPGWNHEDLPWPGGINRPAVDGRENYEARRVTVYDSQPIGKWSGQ